MMTLIIIVAALITIAALMLAASIRIRANFDDSEKKIRASYTFVGSDYDILKNQVIVSVAGIRLRSFSLKVGKLMEKAAAKKEKTVESENKKPEKKKKFAFSDLKLEYLKMARDLIGGTKIKELAIKIRGGFTEPFYTGKMCGYYWIARGMYPNLMSHVDFRPDFSSGTLSFEGKGLVTLRMYYILRFVCCLLYDRLKQKFAKNSEQKK